MISSAAELPGRGGQGQRRQGHAHDLLIREVRGLPSAGFQQDRENAHEKNSFLSQQATSLCTKGNYRTDHCVNIYMAH